MKESFDYDYLIFIGRFQPPHSGHIHIIDQACKLARRVIVLVGSYGEGRSLRNPWTYNERVNMLSSALGERLKVSYLPLHDSLYNDVKWIKEIQTQVYNLIRSDLNAPWKDKSTPVDYSKLKIGLIGFNKDSSSYYLNLFPQWSKHGHINIEPYLMDGKILSSSVIRDAYFEKEFGFIFNKGVMPSSIQGVIEKVYNENKEEFDVLRKEFEFILKYRKQYNTPYPPTFITVDAVVIQSGHILLVRRKAMPGEGKVALPGGFLEVSEFLRSGVIRELREETGIKVPAPVLSGSIKKEKVYDFPYRSMRGRTVTHAFLIELVPMKDLPYIKGGTDAKNAMWVPLSELKSEDFFEDHYHIIVDMLGL